MKIGLPKLSLPTLMTLLLSKYLVTIKKSCFGCLKRIYLRFKDAAVFYNHSSKVIKVGQSWPSYSNGHTQGHTSFGIFEQGSAIPAV